jgi:hypothetical protein
LTYCGRDAAVFLQRPNMRSVQPRFAYEMLYNPREHDWHQPRARGESGLVGGRDVWKTD